MATRATGSTAVDADVLRADDRRFEAMQRGDGAVLDQVLADDLTYVHSTARLESKAEHIANVTAGKPHYRGIAPRERQVRVHGGVGIVNGISEMRVERDGKEQRFTVRYLAVYARTGDSWRLIAWQSTRVPDA
jgi:ketosteroid isomerase-like protein